MVIITGDSSNDLSKELIEKYNIKILPFNILMNDKEYLDGINITSQMIIDNFNENGTLPKTSAVSIESFREFFSNNLKNEDDKIIHFSSCPGNRLRIFHASSENRPSLVILRLAFCFESRAQIRIFADWKKAI